MNRLLILLGVFSSSLLSSLPGGAAPSAPSPTADAPTRSAKPGEPTEPGPFFSALLGSTTLLRPHYSVTGASFGAEAGYRLILKPNIGLELGGTARRDLGGSFDDCPIGGIDCQRISLSMTSFGALAAVNLYRYFRTGLTLKYLHMIKGSFSSETGAGLEFTAGLSVPISNVNLGVAGFFGIGDQRSAGWQGVVSVYF